jgi:transcriptional regulator with XRE-family HTH domain
MARKSMASLQVRFGQRINRLRKSRGWSFTYLAIHSGIAKSTLLEIEKGRTEARINTIDALAGSFGMTISELFKGL